MMAFTVPLLLCFSHAAKAQVAASKAAWMPPDPPAGFFIPIDLFSKPAGPGTSPPAAPATAELAPASTGAGFPALGQWLPVVHLYASPATEAYFASGGLDAKANQRVWEVLLRKYKIPFKSINSAARLEELTSGVLLLPSAVVLTDREKKAVLSFRAKGGSVMASWLTGVRGENAAWLGFDFMERALNVKVVGTTQAENNDNYLVTQGDNPVTHHLPAGQRIWTERAKEWYPLRLTGGNLASQVMDWTRNYSASKPTANVVFDERRQPGGAMSRSVVLGFPERLWLAADRKLLEAMAYDALEWLLRRPSAYVPAWPHPYNSAFVLAIDAVDIIGGEDLPFATAYEDIGGRATYFALGALAPVSAVLLKGLQDRGHELGYLGDNFEGFKGQSLATQTKRFDTMTKDIRDAGLSLPAAAGFHAPMETYDKTTEKLLRERKFGHYIAFMNVSDARVPFLASLDPAAVQPATVVLPRTQKGPEDELDELGPQIAVDAFLSDLDMAEKMAGLSITRMSNQSFLPPEQWERIVQHLKARRDRIWLATSGQVADWWRERDRVMVKVETSPTALLLTAMVKGTTPLLQPVTIWVNLPESGATMRVLPSDQTTVALKTSTVDRWRSAVVLTGLTPGSHSWQLHFDPPATNNNR